jgi:hypothetical protein
MQPALLPVRLALAPVTAAAAGAPPAAAAAAAAGALHGSSICVGECLLQFTLHGEVERCRC